ncbi:MAG: alpha-amylase, partial [Bifidobacterium castoris]|nr:alpha-amylase [Bifidobacterium castoris]
MTNSMNTPVSWLQQAVFYEVYPQSFNDSNNDGIGDIPGITERLDYIRSLGCNALWINPCFASPFRDAGYDVTDYTRVAERYGTNDDLVDLFAAAHARGMHVLLDLVPGHTSDDHPWFIASGEERQNLYT